MKMFNMITPFPITDNSMVVAAENGWKQTVSNDEIYFKDGKVFVICDEIEGIVYADPSYKSMFETGLTEQEWFNLFPSGTAIIEILPTDKASENPDLYHFYKCVSWAELWESKGKPLRFNGTTYRDLGVLGEVISAPEAASLSGYSLRTIQRLCKSGGLECRNAGTEEKPVWMILKTDVVELENSGRSKNEDDYDNYSQK